MHVLQTPVRPDAAIIVKVIEVPSYTLGDVVLAALSIAGVLVLGAVVLGLVLGLGFIGLRFRRRDRPSSDATDHQRLHLST